MKVLIIGGGGREHAIAWKCTQSSNVAEVFVAPGNAGTALEAKVSNLDIAATDIDALLAFAQQNQIDLTIVGPEAPLVAGICDRFELANLAIFGPSQAAAELEGSKAYAKAFMQRHGIPTAAYAEFTEVEPALAYLDQCQFPQVIKADGLAAGKGVFIVDDLATAKAVCQDCLQGAQVGAAGHRIIIEDFLQGEEASFIVMVDGKTVLPLASSQDHKARDNGDKGPNTGGMGAYSPAPIVTAAMHDKIMREVIHPAIQGCEKDGHPYRGFLYAGLMISATGQISVLEFNCRLGDPETQVILPRLKSDLAELCLAGCQQGFAEHALPEWDPQVALGVVLAAGGYPDQYAKGNEITGLNDLNESNVKCFHAGTASIDDKVVTNGGRVLCLTAWDGNVVDAQARAYRAVNKIQWNNVYYRTDIGYRAMARMKEQMKE